MRRGLRPVEAMAGQADKINAGDLTDRVSPHDPRTEMGRLGAALNGMLARIEDFVAEREASQEATRRFFADASHELRTPLASLRANAELYQQGALPRRDQVDEAMRRITLEAQRMGGLVDDMLRLARLDQHPGQQSEPGQTSAPWPPSACSGPGPPDPQWTWRGDIADGLEVTGDEELLRRADRQRARQRRGAHARGQHRHPHRDRGRDAGWPWRSATTAPASRRTSFPASSTASTGPVSRPGGPVPAWGWPSRLRSPPRTTAT